MKRLMDELVVEPDKRGQDGRFDKLARRSGLGAAVTTFAGRKRCSAALAGGALILFRSYFFVTTLVGNATNTPRRPSPLTSQRLMLGGYNSPLDRSRELSIATGCRDYFKGSCPQFISE
jgi:hypothetical protein